VVHFRISKRAVHQRLWTCDLSVCHTILLTTTTPDTMYSASMSASTTHPGTPTRKRPIALGALRTAGLIDPSDSPMKEAAGPSRSRRTRVLDKPARGVDGAQDKPGRGSTTASPSPDTCLLSSV
jgi:hypothetical protein